MVKKLLSYFRNPICILVTAFLIISFIANQGLFYFASPINMLNNSVIVASAEAAQSQQNPSQQQQQQPAAKQPAQQQQTQQPSTQQPANQKPSTQQPTQKSPQQEQPAQQTPPEEPAVQPTDSSEQTIIGLKLNDPFMTINGAKIEIDPGRGTAPIKPKDRVLIPLTSLVNILGGTVKYEPVRKHIFVTLNDNTIQLIINVKFILINGKPKLIDYPPQIIRGRTMVPVRFVAENCNIAVQWKNPDVTLTANYLPTGMKKAKDFFDNIVKMDNYSKLPKIFEILSRVY